MAVSVQGAERRVEKSAQAFRTISEVAAELDVPQHVLRFWESKFSQVRPLKRGGIAPTCWRAAASSLRNDNSNTLSSPADGRRPRPEC